MASWVAIVNGFGLTLGDSIIGLQALAAAQAQGRFAGRDVVTFRLQPERSPLIGELYRRAPHVAAVHPQPCHDIGRGEPEELIDIRDFAFDPTFRGIAMIDFFLGKLGLDPAAVPPALKHNIWLADAVKPKRLAELPPRYILVCPRAAMAQREMPEEVHRHILDRLARTQPLPVLTQGEPARQAAALPPAQTLDALAGLVAGASLIVSTDTAMVHLADAYAVPCLAFFTTHRPEWRVRDYPLCTPVHLPADLPPALEFARGPQDIAAARAAWFARGDFGWLDAQLDRMVTMQR